MAARDPWDMKSIRRLRFALSARTPLVCMHYSHSHRRELLYDMHFELELGIVLWGRMRRTYERHQMDLGPGGVWLCGMWEPHGWRVLSPSCEVVVLVIAPQLVVNMRFEEAPQFRALAPFAAPPGARPRPRGRARDRVRKLGRAMAEAGERGGREQALWLRLRLVEALLLLQEGWRPPGTAAAPAADAFRRINRAVQMVFASERLVTAACAARACHLSRNGLSRLFQELMGISFAKFALRYRLSSAAGELLRSDRPLKALAARWGFTDASHFHRAFRRHYGCTPAEYRRRGEGT